MTIGIHHSPATCACDNPATNMNLLSITDAIRQVWSLPNPVVVTEKIEVSEANGRVLAQSIHAPSAMPFFDNAAMDGFAVNTKDFSGSGPYRLCRSGIVAAGDHKEPALDRGCCLEILTGAPVPKGADAVVPIEKTKANADKITFPERPWPGAHIRVRGQDIEKNEVLVERGTRINPCHIGLLTANGVSKVNVTRKPRAAVFSTGNELLPAGAVLGSGQIYDCNRPMLLSMIENQGLDVTNLGIVQDDETALTNLFCDTAQTFDLVVSSGSVSVGRRDFIKQAFSAAGGTLDGWKVAIKPGKPVAYGKIGSAVFLGLPGNPYAAWTAMTLFGKAVIQGLLGLPQETHAVTVATAGSCFSHKPGRTEYVPVQSVSDNGIFKLFPIGVGGSGSLFPLSRADGLAVIGAEQSNVAEGGALGFVELNCDRSP